jgi:hypothetical protein
MAHVVVPLSRLTESPPPVCVQCGRPGRWSRSVQMAGPARGLADMAVMPPDTPPAELFGGRAGRVRLPVCWLHRWLAPVRVVAQPWDAEAVLVAGASAEFAAAFKGTPNQPLLLPPPEALP